MGVVYLNPSGSLGNLDYRLQRCQFIVLPAFVVEGLLSVVKKEKSREVGKEEAKRKEGKE